MKLFLFSGQTQLKLIGQIQMTMLGRHSRVQNMPLQQNLSPLMRKNTNVKTACIQQKQNHN